MYTQAHTIQENTGNNSFSFEQRIALFGKAEIHIPSLKQINSLDEIQLGTYPVLEEIDEQGIMHACTGLQHIYSFSLETKKNKIGKEIPVYMFDNHNHALYFWIEYINKDNENIHLIHIDQHSDLHTPPTYISHDQLEHIRSYTNYTCQIATFIQPFLHLYPQTDFTRIKSESHLLSFSPFVTKEQNGIYILDIDLDFRAPEMSIEKFDETIRITRQLMMQADLITIASSPMFLDQSRALELLYIILS